MHDETGVAVPFLRSVRARRIPRYRVCGWRKTGKVLAHGRKAARQHGLDRAARRPHPVPILHRQAGAARRARHRLRCMFSCARSALCQRHYRRPTPSHGPAAIDHETTTDQGWAEVVRVPPLRAASACRRAAADPRMVNDPHRAHIVAAHHRGLVQSSSSPRLQRNPDHSGIGMISGRCPTSRPTPVLAPDRRYRRARQRSQVVIASAHRAGDNGMAPHLRPTLAGSWQAAAAQRHHRRDARQSGIELVESCRPARRSPTEARIVQSSDG